MMMMVRMPVWFRVLILVPLYHSNNPENNNYTGRPTSSEQTGAADDVVVARCLDQRVVEEKVEAVT